MSRKPPPRENHQIYFESENWDTGADCFKRALSDTRCDNALSPSRLQLRRRMHSTRDGLVHPAHLSTIQEPEMTVSAYNALLSPSRRKIGASRRAQSVPTETEYSKRSSDYCFIYEPEMASAALKRVSMAQIQGPSGLTLGQAIIVQFLSALGCGIALVAWYPKLCGYALFPVAVLITGVTATSGSAAIMDVAIRNEAWTFSELCECLPAWMKYLAEVSTPLWYLCCLMMYIQLTYNAVNDQLFAAIGSGSWPYGPAVPGDGQVILSFIIGCAVCVSTTPTSFSGPVAQIMNYANLLATWTVIICAVVKGVVVSRGNHLPVESLDPVSSDLVVFAPEGFVKVIVLLAGSMCCTGGMPQICGELSPAIREKAIMTVPGVVAILQGLCFLAVGLIGYFALGNSIEGDAFKEYAMNYPDWLTTVLQLAISILLYLSTPLVMLPAKSQVYAFMTRALAWEEAGGIECATPLVRHGINCTLVAISVIVPTYLGDADFMVLYGVLAGTAANWINLYLPCFVLYYAKILPNYRAGGPWKASACVACWTFLIATAAVISAALEIYELF